MQYLVLPNTGDCLSFLWTFAVLALIIETRIQRPGKLDRLLARCDVPKKGRQSLANRPFGH
jgi:hypothetical protein